MCSDANKKVIACASLQLKDYEQNYPSHDLELAMVVLVLKIWWLLVWRELPYLH